jgi:integrase
VNKAQVIQLKVQVIALEWRQTARPKTAVFYLWQTNGFQPRFETGSIPRSIRKWRLPEVLSRGEISVIEHQALLLVAHDAGWRLSQIRHLRDDAIDSQRNVIRVRQGKG